MEIHALHGQLPAAEQDLALAPSPHGARKVVLATNVAETSLTVPGVTAVVDSGLVRRVRRRGSAGIAQLVTERVTRAEADQRAGRAGRLGPGRVYRLWSAGAGPAGGLSAAPPPEITTVDLTGLALELAAWGTPDPAQLTWLDPPPGPALDAAWATLRDLGLINGSAITVAGRSVVALGVDPRVGALLVAAAGGGTGTLRRACRIAALIEEGDVIRRGAAPPSADLGLRLDLLDDPAAVALLGVDATVDHARRRRVLDRADRLRRRVEAGPAGSGPAAGGADPAGSGRGAPDGGAPGGGGRRPGSLRERRHRSHAPLETDPPAAAGDGELGTLLLAGWADRIAQRRRNSSHRYRLRHGGGVRLADGDPLAGTPFLVVVDATDTGAGASGGGRDGDALVRYAAPLDAALVERLAWDAARAGAATTAERTGDSPLAGTGAGEVASAPARRAAPAPDGELRRAGQLVVAWDPAAGGRGDVSARRLLRLDSLVVRDGPAEPAALTPVAALPALLVGLRSAGLDLLGNRAAAARLQQRVALCRRVGDDGPGRWPDLSDEALLAGIDDPDGWLVPFLAGAAGAADLAAVDLEQVLLARLAHHRRTELDRLAPDRIVIPSGRKVTVDYGGEHPAVAAKLQEWFGLAAPIELGGGARLRIELLSPAGRVVAVTDDLGRFWDGGYRQVRAELRGRYPKHPWPEDPRRAAPTALTSRAAARSDAGAR